MSNGVARVVVGVIFGGFLAFFLSCALGAGALITQPFTLETVGWTILSSLFGWVALSIVGYFINPFKL